jgi:hypothetical protein
VLSVTNVRTTETIATVEGYAAKNDISFGAGGGFFGGVGAGVVGGGTTTPISAGSSRWRSSMPTASW